MRRKKEQKHVFFCLFDYIVLYVCVILFSWIEHSSYGGIIVFFFFFSVVIDDDDNDLLLFLF